MPLPSTYKAIVVREMDGLYHSSVEMLSFDKLPDNEVLIEVVYSSLNYKDALSATGNKGVTHHYPHTPGIDAAGRVVFSKNTIFQPGDEVMVTGFDLGMNTAGGFGQFIRVPAQWILPLPKGLALQESMCYGTAGLTAAQGILKITQHVEPADGPVMVTGATGGVGVLAVAILAHLGYEVLAVSRKQNACSILKELGAGKILHPDELENNLTKPLLKGIYAAAFDTVGGPLLEYLLKTVQMHGIVTCCGNVGGAKLTTTVLPFILRGLTLAGITSQSCPMGIRKDLWTRLAHDWKPRNLHALATVIPLEEIPSAIQQMLKSTHIGRYVVKVA